MATHECELLRADEQVHWRHARGLLGEYAASLGLDLSFQNFEHEIANLETEYALPGGAFFMARENGRLLGCVGLRRFSDGTGEIKRLYVVPAARGQGVGRQLAQAAVTAGRALGYERLLLDTLPSMQAAQSLYQSLGFKPVDAYRFNPVVGTTFLELKL